MEEAALGFLGEISQAATLRHAVQLLTPAHVLAKTNGAPRRSPVNVPRCGPKIACHVLPGSSRPAARLWDPAGSCWL